MARSIVSIVCLSFLLVHKFIDCETVGGNFTKTLESNGDTQSTISQSPSESLLRDIKPISLDTITNTLEIHKIVELQGRIANTPPKPKGGTAAAATKTIKYKLGKRIPGK